MRTRADYVIVGGGISGAAIAYNLAKKGETDIVVIEKSYMTAGATGRCGAGVRQQWGTKMNCTIAKMAIEFFENAEEILDYDGDIEFKQRGYLVVASNKDEDEQFAKNVALQNSLGIPTKHLTPKQAQDIVPHLNTENMTSATFCATDGHLNPFTMTDAYYKAARRLGVKIHTGTSVEDIVVENGRVQAVVTDKGTIKTDVVINAAGGYAKQIGEMAGIDIPVFSQNREILVTEPVEPFQDPMVISFSKNIYCQQVPHGAFIMGRGDDREPGLSTESTWRFLDEMAKTAVGLLPPLGELRVIRQWGGLYNMSPDRQPIISGTDEVQGFYMACGFSGHGFMFAPMTGLLLSELILGEETTVPMDELALSRFDGKDLEAYETSVV